MLKICGPSIYKPLEITFKSCLESRIFAVEWKKSKCCSSLQKDDKQSLKNYRPISFLSIWKNNHLIFTNESGFKPRDLVSITFYQLAMELNALFEMRDMKFLDVFLDVSKAFDDKVRHEGLIFKFEQNGISRKCLRLMKN